MKKVISIICIALLLNACDSLLDVDPQQSIDEETALSTPGNVRAALVGTYSSFRGTSQYGGNFIYLSDLLGDDREVTWSGTFFPQRQVWTKDIETDNGVVTTTWNGSYNTINRANNVLSAIEILPENERDSVRGEALFMRAAVHWNLVRLFGKAWNDGTPSNNPGVPLVLTPTRAIDEDSNIPRNTVAEVYAQVIQDLTEARDLLPTSNGFNLTTYAASALLSRVYLAQGDYQNAATQASRVIESGNFSLVSNYENVFNRESNSSEDIYSIQVSAQDGANDMRLFYASTGNGGRGDIDVEQRHLDLYEDGDARLDLFYGDGGVMRTGKWRTFSNISVFRLAEMHLTRAEANYRLGNTTAGQAIGGIAPVDEINVIRTRVDLDPLPEITSVDQILAERYVELAFEGHALIDRKRTEQSIDGMPFSANSLVFPIPQREIDVNSQLSQNPGYN